MNSVPVSVVILTKNEEADLPACLNGLASCSDVHVVDSGSSDRTVELAKARGAKCYVNSFKSFGDQRNWSLDNCETQNEWVLFIDADEIVTTEFLEEIARVVRDSDDSIAGYYCCWKTMLFGCWLKYSDSFPRWQLRLVRLGRVRFVDFGHGQKEGECRGALGYIESPYLHYSFSKGWSYWFDKHNRYASLEAAERLLGEIEWREVFGKHTSLRNRSLKLLLSRVPGWPVGRFIHSYFISFGFLDGRAGFHFAVLMGIYEYMIKLKINELRQKKN